MEDIIQNPGLQLILEKSLMCLDNISISAFRLVNQECEKIVHSPRFYLKKLSRKMKEIDIIEDWKQLIKKIPSKKIQNRLALKLAKMYSNTKKVPPKHPLELAQDMAIYNENTKLVKFIIENSNPKSMIRSKVIGGTQARIRQGKIALVKSKRCSMNSLHLAAAFGFEEVARRMINNLSVTTNVANEFGVTPIGVAAFHNQVNLVQLLMPYYENPNVPCKIGITPVHVAAHNGNIEILKLFLASTKDNPNYPENNYGWTPIHTAAQRGYKEIVEILITSIKVNPNVQSIEGLTPLHCAARNGYLEIVELLISVVDNPNIQTNIGWTPLHCAVRKGHLEIVRLLMATTNYVPNVQSNTGYTPMHFAAKRGFLQITKLLMTATNSNPNIPNNDGNTPIHRAAKNGHIEIVKLLMTTTKNPNVPNNFGRTPKNLAFQQGHYKIVELLKQKSIIPYLKN